ncbi:MAG TPA: ABC transporter ATP-binding protein [Alphaproteobacteria bacterium]|nr:ABC transporter ATP-binding protein [Alphaproteobacteria bacterium]
MKNVIETVNLCKFYGDIKAVQDFNFSAQKGEIIALLGPNGAGKSTLMNMITGFLSPTSGKIFVNGEDISKNPLKAKAQIGFLPEGAPIYPDMTVKMFLKYMADLRGASEDDLERAIELAHTQEVLSQKVETLSKGYLRRVGFAQSILSNPPILLLDEPTDGLDPNQKEHMRELIHQMSKDKTILISTHLLDEAEAISSRVVIINHGKIMIDGNCTEIFKKTNTKTLADAFKKLTKE